MAKKKFPKSFSPYFQPHAPYKPLKEFDKLVEVGRVTLYNYENMNLENFRAQMPAEATEISFDANTDYDGSVGNINIIFNKRVKEPNKNYAKQLETYNEQLKEHRANVKEWKKLKAEWDAEQEKSALEHKRKLFNRLKKEFESK